MPINQAEENYITNECEINTLVEPGSIVCLLTVLAIEQNPTRYNNIIFIEHKV